MSRQVLVAVLCDEPHAAMLARHPDFTVTFTAPSGTERRSVDPDDTVGHGDSVALLLDYDAVARALSLSERKVRQLVTDGELPAVNVGRSRRIRRADLEAYVERLGNPLRCSA